MKYLLILLVSFSAIAEDQIVQKLKEENLLLQTKINKNNQFISERKRLNAGIVRSDSTVTKKLQRKKIKTKGISNIYIGFESYDWGNNIYDDAPTISYEMGNKKWSTLFSYGRLSLNDFTVEGTQTIVNILKASVQYNIKALSNKLTFSPFLGYKMYNVNSPDAGNAYSTYESELELDMIQDIEDETGLNPGLAISYSMTEKWDLNFRADLGSTGRVAGLHLGYKL